MDKESILSKFPPIEVYNKNIVEISLEADKDVHEERWGVYLTDSGRKKMDGIEASFLSHLYNNILDSLKGKENDCFVFYGEPIAERNNRRERPSYELRLCTSDCLSSIDVFHNNYRFNDKPRAYKSSVNVRMDTFLVRDMEHLVKLKKILECSILTWLYGIDKDYFKENLSKLSDSEKESIIKIILAANNSKENQEWFSQNYSAISQKLAMGQVTSEVG